MFQHFEHVIIGLLFQTINHTIMMFASKKYQQNYGQYKIFQQLYSGIDKHSSKQINRCYRYMYKCKTATSNMQHCMKFSLI